MPTINANGVTLFYEVEGPEDGPVLVLSNSLGSSLAMWDDVVPALTDTYRTLRYDARGHGRSGSSDTPISIDDLADDLVALLDGLKIDKAHVAGLSLGGLTAQALATRHPERVASLILIATAAVFPPPEFWHNRANVVRAEGPRVVVDSIVPRWFTEAFRARKPDAVERVRQDYLGIERAGYARCCEALAAADLRERNRTIAAPTLVIAGSGDPVATPAMAEALRASIPDAELVVLGNVAHLISVERPEALAEKIRAFLGGSGAHAGEAGSLFGKGLAIRKEVLGADYVDAARARAGAFGAPWQDLITRVAWGEIWGDPTLPRKTRSMLTLAMMIALHREDEFKLHVRPALGNGVTIAELRALIMQASVYAGVPAANAAFKWLGEVLGDELK
jgi:3-oxoadipate enol-lactonase/4-carboxymuconolactone decarboxylase